MDNKNKKIEAGLSSLLNKKKSIPNPPKKEEKEAPKVPVVESKPKSEAKEEGYFLLLDNEDYIPLDFSSGPIHLGRNHQEYFDKVTFEGKKDVISKDHCLLIKDGENIYLSEEKDHPSLNHTYVWNKDHYEILAPEEKHPLDLGENFLIFCVTATLVKD